MNIIVCAKQVIDSEAPAKSFAIDESGLRQARNGLLLTINPYDQNALEVALGFRDRGGAHVTVLSVGTLAALQTLRHALAMGADRAILVDDPRLLDSDPFGLAHGLAQAVRTIGSHDLILAGCESSDTGDAVVGPLLAEELGLSCITYASAIALQNKGVQVYRNTFDGAERIEASLPIVVTITSSAANLPRFPKLRDVMRAAKENVPVWSGSDIGVDPARLGAAQARAVISDLRIPDRESKCEFISGGSAQEQGRRLAQKLRGIGVI